MAKWAVCTWPKPGPSDLPVPATAGDRVTPAAAASDNGWPWRHSWNVEHPALISLECLFNASVLVLTVYRNFISEFSYTGLKFSFTRRWIINSRKIKKSTQIQWQCLESAICLVIYPQSEQYSPHSQHVLLFTSRRPVGTGASFHRCAYSFFLIIWIVVLQII